jgi:hypothetical protein
MPVRIACPGCGTVYSLPEELFAKKIRCKQCQHVFVATSPTAQEEAVPEVLPCDEPTGTEPAPNRDGLRTHPGRTSAPGSRPTVDPLPRREFVSTSESPPGPSALPWIVAGVVALSCLLVTTVVVILWVRSKDEATPAHSAVANEIPGNNPAQPNGGMIPNWRIRNQPVPNDLQPRLEGPAPIPIQNPVPIRPEPPKRPAFDDKFAKSVALEKEKFEVRARFDSTTTIPPTAIPSIPPSSS